MKPCYRCGAKDYVGTLNGKVVCLPGVGCNAKIVALKRLSLIAFLFGAFGCNISQPVDTCIVPVQVGTIIYQCEDGMHARCTDFVGNVKFPNEPCLYDNGKDTPVVCVETCDTNEHQ